MKSNEFETGSKNDAFSEKCKYLKKNKHNIKKMR